MKKEFGPYDESSAFFLAVDTHEKVPAGVLRMIRNSSVGLKTIVDLDDSIKSPIAPTMIPPADVMRHRGIDDLDRCWDGATAAIPRRYRPRLALTHVAHRPAPQSQGGPKDPRLFRRADHAQHGTVRRTVTPCPLLRHVAR